MIIDLIIKKLCMLNFKYIIYLFIFSLEMTEEVLNKIPFFKLLNLQAITNNLDSDSSEVIIIFCSAI